MAARVQVPLFARRVFDRRLRLPPAHRAAICIVAPFLFSDPAMLAAPSEV